jgi:glycosyltransferase involved in cell wall biosynthesis
LARFEAEASRAAAAVLVVNERERDALLALAPDAPVHVVGNGIDLESFRPSEPPASAPVVVFCGVMSYAPNVEGVRWFATEVWPIVRASRADARFLVVGADPGRAVRDLAAADRSIEVTGAVPAVQPYLGQAAVSVAPLAVARGVQNKVLEALASGVPAVVTPSVFDGLPEAVRVGCVRAGSAAEFAAALLSLLGESPDSRRQRALGARLSALAWAERLSPLGALVGDAVSRSAASISAKIAIHSPDSM